MGYIFEDLKEYFEYDNVNQFRGRISSMINRKRDPLIKNIDFKIGDNNQRIFFPSAILKMEKVFKKRKTALKYADSVKFKKENKFLKYDNLKKDINEFLSKRSGPDTLVIDKSTVNVLGWSRTDFYTLAGEISAIARRFVSGKDMWYDLKRDRKNHRFYLTKYFSE